MHSKLFLILVALWTVTSPLHSQTAEKEAEPKVYPVPNPLELEADWWKYFDVPADQLPAKVEEFNKALEKLLPKDEAPEHKEIANIKEDILFNLDLLRQTSGKMVPEEDPKLQFRKEYTLPQILEVNQNLIKTRSEISKLQEKIQMENSRLNLTQSGLDKQLLRYFDLPHSSLERLLTGLRIIEYRVKLMSSRLKLSQLKEILAHQVKKRDLLAEELKISVEKATYKDFNRNELKQTLIASQTALEGAKEILQKLEKEQLHREAPQKGESELFCCLGNYQIITQTIFIEDLTITSMMDEIKLTLFDISQPGTTAKEEEIKTLLSKWEKTIARGKEELKQWLRRLENDHAQISKTIVKMFKEAQEENIYTGNQVADIHLQIDQSFALLEQLELNLAGAQQLLKIIQNKYVEEKGVVETLNVRMQSSWRSFYEETLNTISLTLFYINDQPVTIGTLLQALLTMIGALVFSKYLRKLISKRNLLGRRLASSTQYIVLRVIHYVIVFLAVLIALKIIGVNMTNIAIIAGALGVGIGFGLQTMVNNIISGFTLLLNRYIKVGDLVEMKDVGLARVKAVNLQYTHVTSLDGADQIVPNSVLSTQGLTNWTMKNNYKRFRVPFGVAYGTDKHMIQKEVLKAVMEEPYVVTKDAYHSDPLVWFMSYGDSALNFELVAWVNLSIPSPHGHPGASLLWKIDDVLMENGVEIPFTQYDIHIKDMPKGSSST